MSFEFRLLLKLRLYYVLLNVLLFHVCNYCAPHKHMLKYEVVFLCHLITNIYDLWPIVYLKVKKEKINVIHFQRSFIWWFVLKWFYSLIPKERIRMKILPYNLNSLRTLNNLSQFNCWFNNQYCWSRISENDFVWKLLYHSS